MHLLLTIYRYESTLFEINTSMCYGMNIHKCGVSIRCSFFMDVYIKWKYTSLLHSGQSESPVSGGLNKQPKLAQICETRKEDCPTGKLTSTVSSSTKP